MSNTDPKTLDASWREFVRDALPEEVQNDKDSVESLRDTFYAAAAMTLQILVNAPDPDETLDALCEEAERELRSICGTVRSTDLPS